MHFRRRADSRKLSGGAAVLKVERRHGRLFVTLMVTAVIAAAGALGAWYLDQNFVPLTRFETLADEKIGLEQANHRLRESVRESDEAAQALREELERTGLDLEIGAVTRMELERQIIVLNEQLTQVKEELEFMKTAGEESR